MSRKLSAHRQAALEGQPLTASSEPAAEWVDRSRLKPWDRNPRKNADAVKLVVESIRRFGFAAPIVARLADGEVIAGHTRLLAAEALGIDRVPVRWMDLDPADAHLLALADNKLSEKAEWDNAELTSILSDFSLDDAALAGWDDAEISKLADDVPGFGEEDAPSGDLTSTAPTVCPACGHEF